MEKKGGLEMGSVFDSVSYIQLQNGKTVTVKFGKNRETLLAMLVEKIDELGRVPTTEDVKNDVVMPHPNVFATEFFSFEKAVDLAYSEWCSRNYNEKEGKQVSKRYTDDELIEKLRILNAKLGRRPGWQDINGDPDCPTGLTYVNRFGSLHGALVAAGIIKVAEAEPEGALAKAEPLDAPEEPSKGEAPLIETPKEQEVLEDVAPPTDEHEAGQDGFCIKVDGRKIVITFKLEISFPEEK